MQNSKLVVSKYKNYNAAFLFKNNHIEELFLDSSKTFNVGDIYVGRVSNIKEDIKACFVEFSEKQNGFLSFDEINENMLINRPYDGRLKQGDIVCVQITKEPLKTKGASLSMNLSLTGKYTVVITDDKDIHISSKIEKSKAKDLTDKLNETSFEFGFIVRTNAEPGDSDLIISELKSNCDELSKIIDNMKTRKLYSKLYSGHSSLYERINSLDKRKYKEIITDDEEMYEELKTLDNVRFYNDSFPLNALFSFDKAYLTATSKKINLRNGAFLIIEPTEALTVIDVNSGKFDKRLSKDDYIKNVNEEACIEIARQLRLRNLSGIILVDFINIERKEDEDALISLMKKEIKQDNLKTTVVDFTSLGLMEITREKKYASIYDLIRKKDSLND
ncbi:MAG: ribonuclease E/G [Lachnospiraceae bacterium]|nr:ribonuclease E/G [Lachnospiraceae bacterium]